MTNRHQCSAPDPRRGRFRRHGYRVRGKRRGHERRDRRDGWPHGRDRSAQSDGVGVIHQGRPDRRRRASLGGGRAHRTRRYGGHSLFWLRRRCRAIQGFAAARRLGSRAVPHPLGVPMVGLGRGRGDGRRTRGNEDRVQPLRALHGDQEEPQGEQREDGGRSSARARHGGIVARAPALAGRRRRASEGARACPQTRR